MKNIEGDGRKYGHRSFHAYRLQEAAAATPFSTSQSKTDTPTLELSTGVQPKKVYSGKILRIHYRINPANPVTYTLRIWRGATANDYESNMKMLYESPSGQVADTDYDREVEIPFNLIDEGVIFYSLEYSAASGNAQGFIEVSGECYE